MAGGVHLRVPATLGHAGRRPLRSDDARTTSEEGRMIYRSTRAGGEVIVDLGDPWVHELHGTVWLEYAVQYQTPSGTYATSVWVERTEGDDVVVAEADYWAGNVDRRIERGEDVVN
jgi:hypothetical protein